MKIVACALVVISALVPSDVGAFSVPKPASTMTTTSTTTHLALAKESSNNADRDGDDDAVINIGPTLDRRSLFQKTAVAAAIVTMTTQPLYSLAAADDAAAPAAAATPTKIVVAGATGQTGRRVLERLAGSQSGLSVVAGVRNVAKATESLAQDSTVIRGAMVQKVASVDTASISLQHMDVVKDSVDELAAAMEGATGLVIATGFIPGNPLKMNAEAHAVDNLGTIALVNAAKKAGVKKIVMVSSILTNGRGWGQEKSPGFIVTNAFGGVLDEKLQAELYLRKSGIDYTIVRPGGLKAKPPTGALIISGEDTVNSGEISRDLVADVCVAALIDAKASNKVLEIIEAEEGGPKGMLVPIRAH